MVTLAAATAWTGFVPTAGAAPVEPGSFYEPPTSISTVPGSVVKTEPLPLYLAAPGSDGAYPAVAQRVMYASRTQDDIPVAVTGTFIDTDVPWRGSGPRPTIVVAPGTIGQGDQCAPSMAFTLGLKAGVDPLSLSANQELASSTLWGSMGARVFVTDYIGLGTPGLHTYVNRIEQAHAVLDGARAANALSGDPDAPIGLWGYSQGGGATASAAESAASYAPELNIKGTWAGAPTADLLDVLKKVDGTLIGGVIGYALNGVIERNPSLRGLLDERVSDYGKNVLADLSTQCIADTIVKYPFLRTETLTKDGLSMAQNLTTIPEAAPIFDRQKIGTLTPSAPVLITNGVNDDTIPYGQARELASTWCDRGATVTFRTNTLPPILPGAVLPNHFGPQIIDGYGGAAASYLMDRFADVPVEGCSIE
ncbi:MAG: lipase family protein [Rhodococcus sp. (in: high G+C Gram-positive bacteria)]